MKMIGCVYVVTNTITGRVYIGKSVKGVRLRMAQHISAASRGEDWAFYRALRKHGEEAFRAEEIFLSDCDVALLRAEIAIIAEHRARGALLYNSTDGGQGTAGRAVSHLTRDRIRVKAIGRKLSAEHRAKISQAGRGQTRSPEWRAAMSQKRREYWERRKAQGLSGHRHIMTEEGRRILSESAKRRWDERRRTGARTIGG